MNKTSIAVLSALLTTGVGLGSLAIMNQIPATSNMLNTAFGGEKQIVKEEVVVESEFNASLEKRNLVLVNYILDDGIRTNIVQKGSAVEFYKKPTKKGYACIGWSTTPDGNNMIANVETHCDLYPVFASGDFAVKVNYLHGYTIYNSVEEINCSSLISDNVGYSYGLAGLSKSPDSIELVNVIEPDTEYYAVYYFTSSNSMMSYSEAFDFMDYMKYGDDGFERATIHSLLRGSVTDEIRKLYVRETIRIDNINYSTDGYALSPDSTEIVVTSNSQFEPRTDYYIVYSGYVNGARQLFSYNDLQAKFDIILACAQGTSVTAKYDSLTEYETTASLDGVEFRFVGWSLAKDKIELVNNDFIIQNNIKQVYAIYTRNDTHEIYTTEQYLALKSDTVTRVYTYSTQNLYVHFIENYENDVVIGGTTYEFVGWSASGTSTTLIDGGWEEYKEASFVYGVYRNASTGQLYSRESIYQLYRNNM